MIFKEPICGYCDKKVMKQHKPMHLPGMGIVHTICHKNSFTPDHIVGEYSEEVYQEEFAKKKIRADTRVSHGYPGCKTLHRVEGRY